MSEAPPSELVVVDEVAAFDHLAVDVSHVGLRARRAGIDPEPRLDIARLRRPTAGELWTAVAPLLATRPGLVVWTLGGAAADVEPTEVLAAAPAGFRTVVLSAATAMHVGALGSVEPGVAVEMTAGVSTLATDFDQTWQLIDGWGPILGDRGSGAWIGSQGLSAGLRHRDGVPGGSAMLLDAGRHAFGDERTWAGLLRDHPPAEVLADFAPVVGDLARHDPVARAICELAGQHLADAVCAGARLLPGRPLTATGPLLLVEALKRSVAAALAARYIVLVPALGDTLAGTRSVAEHLDAGGRLPHRPPYVHVQGQYALTR